MADFKSRAKTATEALAHLYVYGTVVEILEGSTAPDRDASAIKSVKRIVAICKKEQQRLLKKYDRAMEGIPHA